MKNIINILRDAKTSIRLIDDSVTEDTLRVFIFAGSRAEVKIYSKNRSNIPNLKNLRRRKTFSKGLKFIVTNHFSSNRYLIIDDSFLYIISLPLRRINSRSFYAIRIFDFEEVKMMLFRAKLAESRSSRQIYGNSYECGVNRYKIMS